MIVDPNKSDYLILVSGDSISRGEVYDEVRNKYALLKDSYVAILRGALKGIVLNAARFGNTVTRVFLNFPPRWLPISPISC